MHTHRLRSFALWIILGTISLFGCRSQIPAETAPFTDAAPVRQPLAAEISVSPLMHQGVVNRNIYGLFTEMVFDEFNGGMWAEMLSGRKFCDLAGDSGSFRVAKPWFAIGKNEHAFFTPDNTIYYCGTQSQKILSEDPANRKTGVAQNNLYFQKDKIYRVRVNLRQRGIAGGRCVVAMESANGFIYAQHAVHISGSDWERFSFDLTPSQTDRKGVFTIAFSGVGTLWVGTASLMPADNIGGYRPDVVQALKDLCAPNIRWPGGNVVSMYHWMDGIGDRDKRPPRFQRELWEPNDVGIDEFIELCRILETEPYLAINAGDGTPEEAAALVEYCNGGADTTYGTLRAKNGYPSPYHIKLWGIGNEMYGTWQHGHVDAETYARRHLAIAKAIRAVDPDIKIVACGARYWEFPRWNQSLFQIGEGAFDYLSLHSYTKKYRNRMQKEDLQNPAFAEEFYYYIVSSPYGIEEQIYLTDEELRREMPDRPDIKIAFDEWNAWSYRMPHSHVDFALRDAIYTAGVFHAFRRQHKAVTLANFSKVVNVLAMMKVNQYGIFYCPQYLAFHLYLNHSGPILVASRVSCDAFPAPEYEAGRPQAIGNIKYLDVSATISEDEKTLYVAVINLHRDRPIRSGITLEEWPFEPTVRIYDVYDEDDLAENTFETPDRITIGRSVLQNTGNPFHYVFKPHSVTILEFARQQSR